MKSIVRKDTGEAWREYVAGLMKEEGVVEKDEEPTDEELRRFDKKRKNKKVSYDDWESPTDPDARIARMKDGRTHLAYKAEQVVDLASELILAAEVYHADQADQHTLVDSVMEAASPSERSRRRGDDRRGRGGQWLSRGRPDRADRGPKPTDVHPRARAAAPSAVDRQAAGAEARRVRQPPTNQDR
jgi:hypothetical protein